MFALCCVRLEEEEEEEAHPALCSTVFVHDRSSSVLERHGVFRSNQIIPHNAGARSCLALRVS